MRKRYLTLVALITVVVISVIGLSYQQTQAIKQSVSNGYQGVLKEQTEVKKIQNRLLKINTDINLFLLNPLGEKLIFQIDEHTQNILEHFDVLIKSEHEYHFALTQNITPLISLTQNLNVAIKKLVDARLDINKQYPALNISANLMGAQQDQINSGLEILQLEIESQSIELNNPEIYPKLLKIQNLWIKNIAQTRIYITNRLASFSTEILEEQGQSLADIHQIFIDKIKTLQKLYQTEDSFEAQDILTRIEADATAWYNNFLRMRAISEQGDWRSDSVIVKTQILPIFDKINENIEELNKILLLEKQKIDEKREQSEQYFAYLFYGIFALFIVVILAILTSLEWMVFRPIRQVSAALKSKAVDIETPLIATSKTLEIANLVEAYQEMDQEVSSRQKALEHQAMHDHLTELPNRFALNQRLEYQLLEAEREQQSFVLFLMDIDFFKEINDTLGHASGDKLLIDVSKRIQNLLRKSDTLARLGGDEFAVLLPHKSRAQAIIDADNIINAIANPFEIQNEKVNIGISIGIVSYPQDGLESKHLLQTADMAMYSAKRKRTGYAFYEIKDNIYSKERFQLINDLTDALENNQLEVYFQPQVDLHTGLIFGAEALLRWQHPTQGFISPEKIIETAERIGIINKLSLHILKKSIIECVKWHQQGQLICVSVNLSVKDLVNKNLSHKLKTILDEQGLDYRYLTLEITENMMMENLSTSLIQLNKLHQLGINISIDDFGTGFSSLAYLKQLPVNELKIDKSFILNIDQDENDQEIVRSTINLGHNLGLKVVAEGVENEIGLKMLEQFSCDKIQGYFISRPVTPAEFEKFIEVKQRESFARGNK